VFKIQKLKNHPSSKVIGFGETAKVEQMSIAKWHEEYFKNGIYYDPRYDRRILWDQIDIERYYLSLVQNMAIQPYWYGDTEKCITYCESQITNPNYDRNLGYFKDVRDNKLSMVAPEYLVGLASRPGLFDSLVPGDVPTTLGCNLISLEGKNRTIITELLYLENKKKFENKIINVGCIPGCFRELLSVAYVRMAGGKAPNKMMIRIGYESNTGDEVHKERNNWRNQDVIRAGFPMDTLSSWPYKKPKNMDLMDLYFTPLAMLKMDDDQALCYTLKWVTNHNFSNFEEVMNDMYRNNQGDVRRFKKVEKFMRDFTKHYYENIDTNQNKSGWKLGPSGRQMLMLLSNQILDDEVKVKENSKKNWATFVQTFHDWFIGKKNSESIFHKDKNNHLPISFSTALTRITGTGNSLEELVKDMVSEVYQPLLDNKVLGFHTQKLFSVTEKVDMYYRDECKRRIDGSVEGVWFSDTSQGKKAIKKYGLPNSREEYQPISLNVALGRTTVGEHIDPRALSGNHTIDNGELALYEYNQWKSDRVPDYN
jgi:hypothetical protein